MGAKKIVVRMEKLGNLPLVVVAIRHALELKKVIEGDAETAVLLNDWYVSGRVVGRCVATSRVRIEMSILCSVECGIVGSGV